MNNRARQIAKARNMALYNMSLRERAIESVRLAFAEIIPIVNKLITSLGALGIFREVLYERQENTHHEGE